jgi:hypothetical protein
VLRRSFIGNAVASGFFLGATGVNATTAEAVAKVEKLLDEYVSSEKELENARAFRESGFRDPALTEAQVFGTAKPSNRHLHESAYELILASEITSEALYKERYRHPVWPGGNSGVTIGIGYDLGDKTVEAFKSHWDGLLDNEQIRSLRATCRLVGEEAKLSLAELEEVSIDWEKAMLQFGRFLPLIMGETEKAFPNSNELSDMSFGALVSLVYNRGSAISRQSDRRREMFEIRELMNARKFGCVPALIRSMKGLWSSTPAAHGLVIRRELEAQLFEAGLG